MSRFFLFDMEPTVQAAELVARSGEGVSDWQRRLNPTEKGMMGQAQLVLCITLLLIGSGPDMLTDHITFLATYSIITNTGSNSKHSHRRHKPCCCRCETILFLT